MDNNNLLKGLNKTTVTIGIAGGYLLAFILSFITDKTVTISEHLFILLFCALIMFPLNKLADFMVKGLFKIFNIKQNPEPEKECTDSHINE